MKISKIEKKKRLYLLELDSKEKLYITEDTIVHFMLSKDKMITNEELNEIQTFAQFSYGKNLALYFLSFKPRTEKEVKDYLYNHDIEGKMIPQILSDLKKDKWIDDHRYAEAYINQNLDNGDKGPYVLRQKLIQKGISKGIIEETLINQDFSHIASKAGQKLYKKYTGRYPTKAIKDKIQQNLLNKGFDYQTAKEVLEELAIEKDQEDDMDLIFRELDKLFPRYQKKYQGYDLKQHLLQSLARKGYDFSDITSALRDYL
ncbi:recombination regulator RecX [Streptococcus sobrinus]|uniref:recombination regulator RecX n=1 Tax=Streptococcus sobrinus TaxID=1310 RepID=UPI0002E64072|nr:recombination regulator RecX [Streptococcus sobrinus]